MSVMVKKALEKHLESLTAKLSDTANNDEIKKLEERLKGEKDLMIQALIQEKLNRLTTKDNGKQNVYQQYRDEFNMVASQIRVLLERMETIPAYVTSTRGRKPGTKTGKRK